MNKKALLDYALFARKELETQIALSLNKLGIYKDKILKANVVGDYTIIEGNPDSYPKRVYGLRKMMVSEYFEGEEKFETVVEEFAYTWFNRLVAIRFMEIHDYFPHGFHVLTSRDGSYEPEILSNLPYVLSELNLEEDVIRSLRDQNKIEELYRYVLVKQCSALSKIIPDIFDVREPYLELLLPNNLLSQDSVIRKIELIPEEDFMNDIEVVGWLYQFYNSVKKDEVFASKETITKDTLPAVTQLFTPDWIVRYMADNSVGRLWLESYPNSSLKQSLKYYIEDAKQDEETQKKLDEIKYKNVNPEEIKIIEPCCGSGHILVYVFDLLLGMYLEQGYNKRDIPALILKNNLYGLDVDKRAAQLAKFSLIMKARSIDNRFFNEDRFVNPRVFEIKDSQLLIALNYKDSMKSLHFSEESIKLAEYLVDKFEYGKVIGSLLKVAPKDYSPLVEDIKRCKEVESPGIFEQDFYDKGLKRLRYLVRVARVLSRKYDVMITNPPYIGISTMEKTVKKYAESFYPDSKTDMYAMFMETDFVKKNGFVSMINMHGWMFIDSFLDMRKKLLNRVCFLSLVHHGIKAFETIGNDVVQTCSFVFKNIPNKSFKTLFIRLADVKDYQRKITEFFNPIHRFTIGTELFLLANTVPFAYWVSEDFFKNYSVGGQLSDYGVLTGTKNVTGNNERFLRQFWEVDINHVNKDYWAPYSKGGFYRKYYGNITYVVDWRPDAKNFYQTNKTSSMLDSSLWFKEGITYSAVTSRGTGFRYFPEGYMCDGAGPVINIDKKYLLEFLGFLNTKVADLYLSVINPTINLTKNDLKSIPYILPNSDELKRTVQEQIDLAKEDWSESETTFEFETDPLVSICRKFDKKLISDCCEIYKNSIEEKYNRFEKNEHYITDTFKTLYKLNDYTFEYERRDISIKDYSLKQAVTNLISYFIGCLMGRYSLEKNGLVYAGGKFDSNKYGDYLDEDGVLPVYQFVGINDGLTQSICNLIKLVFGDAYYKSNLEFVANSLGRKTDEGAIETINRYLNEDFYKDHLKLYQNRPIYWMLSSGKIGAFKCLIYLHRYDKNTLAKINAKYFLPRTALYKAERERLSDQWNRADIAQRKKIDVILKQLEDAEEELNIYGQILDHMANKYIDIDLDDGVKTNYVKFQGVSIVVNGATIKKDLLVPFGLEK